jgi:predicted metal-dependent hydrolase
MPKITLKGQNIPYTVRKSQRAKSVRLRIDAKNGLQVVVPKAARGLDVEAVLLDSTDWILKHYAKVQQVKADERRYVTGETIPYLGREWPLEVIEKRSGKLITVTQNEAIIRVSVPADIPVKDRRESIRSALEAWYRRQAKEYLGPRVAHLARQHGFEYERITIKGQTTRWGSCSSNRNLNFNYRLMMTPPVVIDYVIIHELCHLREMNHSPRFWALVAQYCPDYKQWVTWLKKNSARLVL